MKYDQHIILKHLDAPIRVLSFSLNDLVIYALPLFIGSFLDDMLLLPSLGFLTIYAGKKMVRKFPRYYLINFLYWNLPTKQYRKIFRTKLIPSEKRFWV